jgi:SAM-dependent MidA family methyltransferase
MRLSEAAAPDGFLRFDRFMDIALYGRDVGFYSNPSAALGPRGQYYTASHVSPLFGRAIARRVVLEHERAGRPHRWSVVELGAGDGGLAASVIEGVGAQLAPGVEVTYTIVERSPSLADGALARARAAASGTAIRVGRAGSLAEVGPLRGVVLANELLDALPFRRIVRRSDGWRELGVRVEGGRIDWAEGATLPPFVASTLPGAEEGTELEYGPASEALPREVADHLVGGVALLIDYGMEEGELVSGHPRGTIAALRAHRPVADPLEHPGLTDLSAFVNFTRVRRAARAAGLEELGYRPQREALVEWGIEPLLGAELARGLGGEHEVRTRLAVKNLLFGFERFQVLELGVPTHPRSRGGGVGDGELAG